VPFLPDADKPPLLDERAGIKKTRGWWAGLAAATAPVSLHTFGIPSAVCGVMIAVLEIQLAGVERALDDPASDDVYTTTRARPRRYRPGALGDDPIARATDAAAVAVLRYAGHLEAVVRADERAQGARLRGLRKVETERLLEAERLLEQTRSAVLDAAQALDTLSIRWATVLGRPELYAGASDVRTVAAVQRALMELASRPPPELAGTGLDLEGLRHVEISEYALMTNVEDGVVGSAESSWTLARTMAATPDRISGARPIDVTELHRLRPPEAREGWTLLDKLEAPPVSPPEWEYLQGVRARDKGRISEAERAFLSAAEESEPASMFELGMLDLARNAEASAESWFRQSASMSYPDAAFQLGLLYRRRGERDLALERFNEAAWLTELPGPRPQIGQ
jgi:hypothetical protein